MIILNLVSSPQGRVTVLSSGAGSSKAKAKEAAADQQQNMKIVASFRVTQQVAYLYSHEQMLRSNEILPALLGCTYATSNLPYRSARRRRSRASSLPGGASPSSSTPQTELSEFTGRGHRCMYLYSISMNSIVSFVHRTSQVLSLKDGDRDPEPDQKLQDLVNKTMWKKCCFSGDGEYVCAGSARQVL